MKKVIFLVAALMAVFSGIAAVSAFEGHAIDIKAHVENALGVEKYEWDLGVRFPQQVIEDDLTFGLSESFLANKYLSSVDYKLAWELKSRGQATICKPVLGTNPLTAPYYQALNPYLTMSLLNSTGTVDATKVNLVPAEGEAIFWATGFLTKTCAGPVPKSCEIIHLKFSVPVFDGYYNAITDATFKPGNWVFGSIPASKYCLEDETICGKTMQVPHADLGIVLKIQVTGYQTHATPCAN
jgi:hypothetical protein